jgi:uncharacterized protein (DUF2235 family)
MKRIVICADGTWNERDRIDEKTGRRHPTNVTKVARAIRARASDGIDQVVYYHDGVGTGGGVDKFTGGAFGEGIEANVRDLYRFILYNYEERDRDGKPDQLFFFGFSRGAFTVRTLAGFMKKVDLLHKDDDYYIPEAYGCYEKSVSRGSAPWKKAFHNVKPPRACPKIAFVGVWDTVGALGAPGAMGQALNRDKYKYHDIELGPHIENAFHAMAIDERRRPFLPNLWTRNPDFTGQLEQAWFPGVHSNVGGSYSPDGLANEALHWLVGKAEGFGLEVDDAFLAHYTPCFNSTLNDSMTAMYRVLRPASRTIGAHAADGECIHQAAIDRLNHAPSNYAPANLTASLRSKSPLPIVTTTRVGRGMAC